MQRSTRSILLRRDVAAWCLYDWANSAWVTSIATVLLPLYFLALTGRGPVRLNVLGLTWVTSGKALWGYANAVYMVAIAATAPVLGAMADALRGKKRFLGATALLGSALTCLLALVGDGQYLWCAALFIGAGYLWSASNVFYDAFLPELAGEPSAMDAISAAGYGVGYLGGGLVLAANLWMLASPGTFGLPDVAAAFRVSFVLIGLWWAAFTLPLLWTVAEQGSGGPRPARLVRDSLAQVARTLRKVRRLPELARFLAAFFFYNSGIGTVIVVAAVFAKDDLALGDADIAGCMLMVQFVGLPAAFGFIRLARQVGTRNSIIVGVVVYIAVVVYAMQVRTAVQFWVLGFLVALVQGGTQAISRSLFGSMIPPRMSAEFYSFFSIFNKVGPFLGPFAFALVCDLTGSSRLAILFLVSFFVLGLLMLLTVRVGRGIRQAGEFAEAVDTW